MAAPDAYGPGADDRPLPLLEHLRELRRRFLWCLALVGVLIVLAFYLYPYYIGYFISPFGDTLYRLGIEQAFTLSMRVACYVGLTAALPFVLFILMGFVARGLTPSERRLMYGLLVSGLVLATLGGLLAYIIVLPVVIRCLNSPLFLPPQVKSMLDLQHNVLFVFHLLFGFMLLFQLPLPLLLLLRLNILTRATLLGWGRYVIVIIFIVAAVVTPPDVFSQLALALPLVGLYFLTILAAKLLGYGGARR